MTIGLKVNSIAPNSGPILFVFPITTNPLPRTSAYAYPSPLASAAPLLRLTLIQPDDNPIASVDNHNYPKSHQGKFPLTVP